MFNLLVFKNASSPTGHVLNFPVQVKPDANAMLIVVGPSFLKHLDIYDFELDKGTNLYKVCFSVSITIFKS